MLMYARSVRGVRDDFVLDRVRIHCFECLGHSAVCFQYIYLYMYIYLLNISWLEFAAVHEKSQVFPKEGAVSWLAV